MALTDRVRIARRFQRSIRIDTDLKETTALEGFVCPQSSAVLLETMAHHVSETGQGAFTWTGPYGSGKSSLVIVLSAALCGQTKARQLAAQILGAPTSEEIWKALPPGEKGWRILPVVGRRERPAQVVGEAISKQRLVRNGPTELWTEEAVFDTLTRIAKRAPKQNGGLLVFIDEMGKFLEGAAYDGTDIYFFQQLAELASRSNGRLVVVGILHQAFEEYTHRLSREMRDEWAKIQGRFIDLAVNTGWEEQLDLLGRAIESDQKPRPSPNGIVERVARLTRPRVNARLLASCWPLHPIVACLLGPISRRRFGQNQRSIFGFLNSTEPQGFRDFLQTAEDGSLYTPDRLWDYLKFNLEPSIMASPDGHRWAMAVDALDRCQGAGGDEFHLRLLKTIALVDLFKERSGLTSSLELLGLVLPGQNTLSVEKAVSELEEWSLVLHRKLFNSYGIFEGSDFDIERAIDQAYEGVGELDFGRLTQLAGLQPVIAKRHYHETGALRWCDTALVALSELDRTVTEYVPSNGAIGAFFLALPTQGDSPEMVERIVERASSISTEWEVVVGVPERAGWSITSLARDLMALEKVRDGTPELQGDRIARREVQARIADLQGYIESELGRALDQALWHRGQGRAQRLDSVELNSLASDLADSRFPHAPRLHNELLNRMKPSSNAVAARNALLKRMALHEGEQRLGIEGYPPEGGLFDSLLLATSLYAETTGEWRIVEPNFTGMDPSGLAPAWRAATDYLQDNSHTTVPVSDIYDIWRKPPFGIRDGLLPLLAVAFLQSRRGDLALYREGVFQPRLTDLDVEYLSNEPSDVQLRWMEMSGMSRQLLSDLAGIVRDMDPTNALSHLEPIDVARGLVSIYDRLPAWIGHTQRLSNEAKRVRQLFKRASDPNRFIFDDIPHLGLGHEDDSEVVPDLAAIVRDGLTELSDAYPNMLHRLRETLLVELGVSSASPSMLAELRARAKNIRQLSGNHRLEAFILRISQYEGTDADMESLASMAVNKPPRQWADADIDRAAVELADMARSFTRHEAYAHVKGRPDHRLAMAVVVGLDGEPIHDDFEITEREQSQVDVIIKRVRQALTESGAAEQNVILAALARVTAEYLESRGEARVSESRAEVS